MPALLNQKREIYAQELAKGKTADEAYVLAGYRKSRSNASTLKANQSVLDRVLELQAGASERAEMTIESLIREADEIQQAAFKAGQFSAANAALISKAKLAGRWIEKTDNTNRNVNEHYVVADEPIDNIEQWEAEHSPKH